MYLGLVLCRANPPRLAPTGAGARVRRLAISAALLQAAAPYRASAAYRCTVMSVLAGDCVPDTFATIG
jgi:hypothetical protein